MTPADVQREARSLVGTKIHHCGRHATEGIDCGGVVVVTARRLKYPHEDISGYAQWPEPKALMATLRAHWDEVAEPAPGRIGVLWFDRHTRAPQHLVLFVEHPLGLGIIHAYERAVVEHLFRPVSERDRQLSVYRKWQTRLCHVFEWRGIQPCPR
jgi:hypothetical protein